MTIHFLEQEMMNDRIMIKCSRSIEFIQVSHIVHIESSRSYSKLHRINETDITLSFPLKKMENKLSAYPIFFRCHKSHLINLTHIKSYHSDNGIKLIDGSYVPLAKDLKVAFIKKMDELFGGHTIK